ncbi:hypothetical protein [Sorangium sp. So ce1151]|uniref:hypothetical protein n=1 Tax=Sorangium sp. So ce1151 TaxID=3133332 RepID=UPI003F5F779B
MIGASVLYDGHLRCVELLTITHHARCVGLEQQRDWAVIAANAASFTLKAVPAMLGEVWVLEGLSQNDPRRIADGIVMAASGGASFGAGLGAGGKASGGVQ